MTPTLQQISSEDLLQMPKDGFRYELIRGELKKMTPAGYKHGKLAMRLASVLFQYVEAHKLGIVCAAETGFKLSSNPDTVRAPDVSFVSQKRIEESGEPEGYWPGAPDLAVEVISPGDMYTEVEEKVSEWLDAGTRMVMLVNSRKHTVTIYHSRMDIRVLTEHDALDGRDVVPGWAMPVKDLFA